MAGLLFWKKKTVNRAGLSFWKKKTVLNLGLRESREGFIRRAKGS